MSIEEIRRISLAKTRSDKYPLEVTNAQEYGVLTEILPFDFLMDPSQLDELTSADIEFADLINATQAISNR